MATTRDVFVSYARRDRDRVLELVSALERLGLSVWRDDADEEGGGVPDFESIQQSIETGLAQSRVFVPFYTATYPTRTACQWELAAAVIAEQALGVDDRVVPVNGEVSTEHIVPVELADRRLPSLPAETAAEEVEDAAKRVATHVRSLTDKSPLRARAPGWVARHGSPAFGVDSFEGRVHELWALHSELAAASFPLITGRLGQVVVVSGLGGMGKTMLVQQYASRFAAAYPGGVFWLQAHGGDDAGPVWGDELRAHDLEDQLANFADALSAHQEEPTIESLRAAIAREIERKGVPCLWVADDLPSGLTLDELAGWTAPHSLARTLVTSRARDYDKVARSFPLGSLTAEDGLAVLTRRGPPEIPAELDAARSIVEELGGHALALDLAGAWLELGTHTFCDYLDLLRQPSADVVELAGQLDELLPTGHERSITGTIARSLAELEPPAYSLAALAVALAPEPIPVSLVAATFALGRAEHAAAAREITAQALAGLRRLSLAELGDDVLAVHSVVRRAMRATAPPEQLDQLRDAVVAVVPEPPGDVDAFGWVLHARHLGRDPRTPEEVDVIGLVASFEHHFGRYRAAERERRRQLEAYGRLVGERDPRSLQVMDRLALTLMELEELREARLLAEAALEGRRAVLGPTAPDTITSMNTLAVILSRLVSDFAEYGFDRHWDPGEGSPMQPPATLDDVERLRREVLDAEISQGGADVERTLPSKANLAGLLYDQGQHDEARALMEDVVATSQQVDPDGADTLTYMTNLATMLARGDMRRRRDICRDVVERCRDRYGRGHVLTLKAMNQLAEAEWGLGRLKAARRLWSEVYVMAQEIEPDHPVGEHAVWSLVETKKPSHRVRALGRRLRRT